MTKKYQIAVLDDYQNVALQMADWSALDGNAEITVFNHHLGAATQVVHKLQGFDIVCIMRERTRFPREVLEQLDDLQLLITSGARNAAIDLQAASDHGIMVCGTASPGHAASELTWGLILALSRKIVAEDNAMRQGLWQTTIGRDLRGQTLGIIGLGRHGANVAAFAKVFGMRVIAWSENLTRERCDELGVEWVDKQTLMTDSDIITIHLKMGTRYRGLIDRQFLSQMKSTAYLINTSRGPIINEADLISALNNGRIAGAGLDVYAQEPLAENHPLRAIPNSVLTSHVGFVTEQTYRVFYGETVDVIQAWLRDDPINILN
ncbi:MAG: D-2-hydroxyacid dehydrogenase family protein [Gammaproteobacteria bacterium]|nr:D-2-hydroxyacid dehydrogenase family protein [Gammaproteobacteria bacterium]